MRGAQVRRPGIARKRRKSEPALASQATSGFLFVQRNGFVIVALKYPVQPGRQFRRGVPEHGRVEQNVHSASNMRSNRLRLHGEIEFFGTGNRARAGTVFRRDRGTIVLVDTSERLTTENTEHHEGARRFEHVGIWRNMKVYPIAEPEVLTLKVTSALSATHSQ
jgi:hypothetical protein